MDIRENAQAAALAKAREIIGDGLIDAREVRQVADAVAVAVLTALKQDAYENGRLMAACIEKRLAAFTPAEPPQQETKLLRAPTTEPDTVADLRDDDWDEIEDGLSANIDASMEQAHLWEGRKREAQYRSDAERAKTVLAKVQKLRAGTVQELSRASVTPSASAAQSVPPAEPQAPEPPRCACWRCWRVSASSFANDLNRPSVNETPSPPDSQTCGPSLIIDWTPPNASASRKGHRAE